MTVVNGVVRHLPGYASTTCDPMESTKTDQRKRPAFTLALNIRWGGRPLAPLNTLHFAQLADRMQSLGTLCEEPRRETGIAGCPRTSASHTRCLTFPIRGGT